MLVKQAETIVPVIENAIRNTNWEELNRQVSEYGKRMAEIHATLDEFDKVSKKRPGSFKSLEINLRKQIRRLNEGHQALPVVERAQLRETIKQAEQVRKRLLRQLLEGKHKK